MKQTAQDKSLVLSLPLPPSEFSVSASDFPALSPKHLRVLREYFRCDSVSQIASRLRLTIPTIQRHLKHAEVQKAIFLLMTMTRDKTKLDLDKAAELAKNNLLEDLHSDDPILRHKASTELLDRTGYGKGQQVQVQVSGVEDKLTDALKKMYERRGIQFDSGEVSEGSTKIETESVDETALNSGE